VSRRSRAPTGGNGAPVAPGQPTTSDVVRAMSQIHADNRVIFGKMSRHVELLEARIAQLEGRIAVLEHQDMEDEADADQRPTGEGEPG
jgi:hypothetical protein